MHVWEAEILSANFDQVREKSHKLRGHAVLGFRVFMAQVKRQRSLVVLWLITSSEFPLEQMTS